MGKTAFHAVISGFNRRNIITVVSLFIAYFIFSTLGIFFPESGRLFAAIWPASGISLAALLMNPQRLWPALLTAVFAAGALSNTIAGKPLPAIAGFMAANTLESLLCAFVFMQFLGKDNKVRFNSVKEIVILIFVIFVINPVTAAIGAGTAAMVFKAVLYKSWFQWALGDGFGMLLMAPLVVLLFRPGDYIKGITAKNMTEAAAAFILLSLASLAVFQLHITFLYNLIKPYVLFPFIIWIALRFLMFGNVFAVFLTAVIALSGHGNVSGWAEQSSISSVYDKQLFLSVLSLAGFLAAATMEELNRVQKEKMEKSKELNSFFELSIDMLCIANTEGYFLKLNPEWARALGYDIKMLEKARFLDFVHPEDMQATLDVMKQLEQGKPVIDFINRYRHSNGSYRWIEWRSASTGKSGIIYAAARDITDRINNEEALRQSEQNFRQLFDNMGSGVAVYEAVNDCEDFIIRDFNKAALKMEKVRKQDIIGRSVLEVFPGVREFGLFDVFCRVWKTGTPEHHPVGLYKDKRILGWRENFVYKLPNSHVAAVYNDVTDRKRAEQVIVEKNAELERFLYTVSHDLKNPLITISGFSGALKSHVKTGNMAEALKDAEFILGATANMNMILKDLLEITKLGMLENKPAELEFGKIIEEAVNVTAGEIKAKNAEILVMDPAGKEKLHADRRRMIEVIQNLISNAVKFSRAGEKPVVEIGVRKGYNNYETVYYVRDNGIGIEKTYQEKIFVLFERLEPDIEGTGIGLPIVKRIIELHGGRVWVESDGPGKGSVFYFTIGEK